MGSSGLKALKANFGRWTWKPDNERPKWEAVSKCPLWASDEWEALRQTLQTPVPSPTLIVAADDKPTVLWRNATKPGEPGSGPNISICKLSAHKSVPAKIGNAKPKAVCYFEFV